MTWLTLLLVNIATRRQERSDRQHLLVGQRLLDAIRDHWGTSRPTRS